MTDISGNGRTLANNWAVKAVLPVTALTLFLSAFLLFSVQPFFAKMVLPRLGGSPAVWSVAMVFFQSALLAGYGYAHLLTSRFSLRTGVILHLIVLTLGAIALPIAIPAAWSEPPQAGQAFWLIGLFSVSVGFPFFALSANGPLLQAWFAKAGHPHADDPYFLYGASNIGSFASLILYVVLIEPSSTLGTQGLMWNVGYALLIACVAACGMTAISSPAAMSNLANVNSIKAASSANSVPVWKERLVWIALAFVPSALLVAVTAHVSTDVAAVPFLWIIPLALFLLTFVIVFQRTPLVPHWLVERLAPPAIFVVLFFTLNSIGLPIYASVFVHFAAFFLTALYVHGVLAARRPTPERLTEFYFCMSTGGVLGGAFTSLLAPHLFSWVAEYPLMLVVTLFVFPKFRSENLWKSAAITIALGCAITLILLLIDVASSVNTLSQYANMVFINIALMIAGLYFLYRNPRLGAAAAIAIVANAAVFYTYFLASASERSFFGIVRILEVPDKGVREIQHGTTLHGAMRLADAKAEGRPLPLTYYTSDGGLALAVAAARENFGGNLDRVGVIGTGAGSLACQLNSTEKSDFYEIDPAVIKFAMDPNTFRFLSNCAPDAAMIVGDGRIEIAKKPDATYNVLVIDAFSSDSIPVHLMTVEAVSLFMSKVKPHGLLAMHITNHHLELQTVVSAIGEKLGFAVRTGRFIPENTVQTLGMAMPTTVAVLARDEADLTALDQNPNWKVGDAATTTAWTDDYSNVLASLWRGYRHHDELVKN